MAVKRETKRTWQEIAYDLLQESDPAREAALSKALNAALDIEQQKLDDELERTAA